MTLIILCSVSFSTCLFCGLQLGIHPLRPLFFLSGQWDYNCFSHQMLPMSLLCNCDYGNNKASRTSSYWRPADAGRCWPIPSTSARRQHTEALSCEQSGSFWGRRKWVETAIRDVQTLWVPSLFERDVIHSWHLWNRLGTPHPSSIAVYHIIINLLHSMSQLSAKLNCSLCQSLRRESATSYLQVSVRVWLVIKWRSQCFAGVCWTLISADIGHTLVLAHGLSSSKSEWVHHIHFILWISFTPPWCYTQGKTAAWISFCILKELAWNRNYTVKIHYWNVTISVSLITKEKTSWTTLEFSPLHVPTVLVNNFFLWATSSPFELNEVPGGHWLPPKHRKESMLPTPFIVVLFFSVDLGKRFRNIGLGKRVGTDLSLRTTKEHQGPIRAISFRQKNNERFQMGRDLSRLLPTSRGTRQALGRRYLWATRSVGGGRWVVVVFWSLTVSPFTAVQISDSAHNFLWQDGCSSA